jgi:hypothetical protein
MSTIFISHSSRDNQMAKELEERLAQENHPSVFLDLDPEKGIVAGQSWERTLYRKLRACRAVIALCTDHYLRSNWCFAEIALARMEGKHIFALQVDPLSVDTSMPSILTEKQFIDLRVNREKGYRRLWRGLKEVDLLGVSGEWDPKRPPYLGLDVYKEEHAPVFFGREDETRAAIELLDRGAPGLIMALGASGSGKSSLVRAGMLPRLRREPERWLLIDPFRPGRDPFAELADALILAYRRYAPDHIARLGSAEDLRDRLEAGAAELVRHRTQPAVPLEEEERDAPSIDDERLQRLMGQLEELSRQPPMQATRPLLDFLNWSIEDLRRIFVGPLQLGTTPETQLGTTPLVTLADHLRRVSERREARVLLVIDQFEEMLGQDESDGLFHRFLTLLRASVEVENSPLMALGTMRSDFLGVFQRHPALRGIDFESLSLGPMKTDGMRRVIEAPAKLGMIELETGLADRLIEDTETPDALPLLSFTLLVLWRDYHEKGRLSIRDYDALDGLHGAVAKEADAVLAPVQREGVADDLQRALIQMARPTESGGYARQLVRWDAPELRPVHAVLERLVERRLLVSREEGGHRMVEVAHEALFRSWQPLKTWLDNHRSELLLRQQLERDAEVWETSQRAADNLWRGGRLQQAQELMRQGMAQNKATDVDSLTAFIRAGVWRRNRQRWIIAGITLCVFAALTWFYLKAERQRQIAEDQAARVKNALMDMMDYAAEGVASEIDSQLKHLQVALKAVRDMSDPDDVEEMYDVMEQCLKFNRDIKALLLIPDPEQVTIYNQDFYHRFEEADLKIDQIIKQFETERFPIDPDDDGMTIGKPAFIPELDEWLTTMILRLRKIDVVALISLNKLRQYVKDHPHNKGGKSLWLVDAAGHALLSTAPGHANGLQVVKDALKNMNVPALGGTSPYLLPDGTRRLGTFRIVEPLPWAIILDRQFP